MAQLQFEQVGTDHYTTLEYDARVHRTINAAMSSIIADGPDLSKLHIQNSRLSQIGPLTCDNGRFRNSVWEGLAFKDCIFLHCDFSWARFNNVTFDNCRFIDCRLDGLDFGLNCQWMNGSAFLKCEGAMFISSVGDTDVLRLLYEGKPLSSVDFLLGRHGVSKRSVSKDEREATVTAALHYPELLRNEASSYHGKRT